MAKVGVYAITNRINGHKYIGISVDIRKRFHDHIKDLKGNYHKNGHLQKAWNKYGEENFCFSVLEECFKDKLCDKEVIWVNRLKSFAGFKLYNMCEPGNIMPSQKGRKYPGKNSDKVGKLNPFFGRKHTKETIQKIKNRCKEVFNTPEMKQKIRESHLGNKPSLETREKMRQAQLKRYGKVNENRCFVCASKCFRNYLPRFG